MDGDGWVQHRIQGEKKVQKAQLKVEIFKNPKSSKVGGGGEKKIKKSVRIYVLKCIRICNFFWHTLNKKIEKILEIA